MNNNSTGLIIGVIAGIALGGFGGYVTGQKSAASVSDVQVAEMTRMMKSDGAQMMKMGGMMMAAGTMMEERGVKISDQEMMMMGKDLSASGKKHQMDGQSMTGGDMMGMMDMPGMDHSGMQI
jgi:hypothetical protein